MRIHAVIDDDLFDAALAAMPGARSRTAVLEEALRALVERHAARELAQLIRSGGFAVDEVPRRRVDP